MFEQQAGSGDGGKYMQLHVEATDMGAVLNNANYSALLGFVQVQTWIHHMTPDFISEALSTHRRDDQHVSLCRLASA